MLDMCRPSGLTHVHRPRVAVIPKAPDSLDARLSPFVVIAVMFTRAWRKLLH